MGSYAYCMVCQGGMQPPSFSEIIYNKWPCPSCGMLKAIDKSMRNDALVELHDDLLRMEERWNEERFGEQRRRARRMFIERFFES